MISLKGFKIFVSCVILRPTRSIKLTFHPFALIILFLSWQFQSYYCTTTGAHNFSNRPPLSTKTFLAFTMSKIPQNLFIDLIFAIRTIFGAYFGSWIHVKELLSPLESCQFVLTTGGLWPEQFPQIGTAILSAITGMNNHVQLLSTLRHYRREQYVIRHQNPFSTLRMSTFGTTQLFS